MKCVDQKKIVIGYVWYREGMVPIFPFRIRIKPHTSDIFQRQLLEPITLTDSTISTPNFLVIATHIEFFSVSVSSILLNENAH